MNTYISLSAEDDENTLDDIWAQSPETMAIDREYYLEGCSYVEISHLLEKSPKSIDNALQRIKAKIREQIS